MLSFYLLQLGILVMMMLLSRLVSLNLIFE